MYDRVHYRDGGVVNQISSFREGLCSGMIVENESQNAMTLQ